MKILIIHNQYQQAGGEKTAVEAQVQLLRQHGHEVILYLRDNDEIKGFNFWQKINFVFQTIFSMRTVRDLTRIIRAEKPQIAHVHNVFPLISPSVYRVLRKNKVPVIQTIHNFRFLCPNGLFYTHGHICERCTMGNMLSAVRWRCYRGSRLLSALYAFSISLHRRLRTFNKIDGFITLNPFTSQKLVEGGVASAEKIEVIGNCITLPSFSPENEKQSADAVYIGRLSAEKGLMTLQESVRLLPGLRLHIAGSGPLETLLRQKAAALGLDDRVIFDGFVTGDRKWKLLSDARMVIIPSECYEQFPVTALEAMAAGTAIVASEIGGLPSIVRHGVNGLLAQPGNAADLAEKMQVLMNDPALAQEMGRNGRRMVETQFSAEAHLEKLLLFYQKVLNRYD